MIGKLVRRCVAIRSKISIGRMMIAVAITAPFLMTFREDAKGSLPAGLLIVAGSVVALALVFDRNAMARFSSDRLILNGWRRVRVALASILLAIGLILAADFVFLAVYEAIVGHLARGRSHSSFHLSIQPWGVVLGLAASLVLVLAVRLAAFLVGNAAGRGPGASRGRSRR